MKEEYQYRYKVSTSKDIAYFFVVLFFIGNLYFLKKLNDLNKMSVKQELEKDSVLYLQVNLLNKLKYLHISIDSLNSITTNSLKNIPDTLISNKSLTNK